MLIMDCVELANTFVCIHDRPAVIFPYALNGLQNFTNLYLSYECN